MVRHTFKILGDFREIFEANAGRVEYLSDKLKKQGKLVEERTENFIVEKNQRQLMFTNT